MAKNHRQPKHNPNPSHAAFFMKELQRNLFRIYGPNWPTKIKSSYEEKEDDTFWQHRYCHRRLYF